MTETLDSRQIKSLLITNNLKYIIIYTILKKKTIFPLPEKME